MPTEQTVTIKGENSTHVKLISGDNHEYVVRRELALSSETIRHMLNLPGPVEDDEPNVINFRDIPAFVLQHVIYYLHYKLRFTNTGKDIPEFKIEPEVSLGLLLAADFFRV